MQVMMLAKLVKIKRLRIDVAVCLFNCVTDLEKFALKLWECVSEKLISTQKKCGWDFCVCDLLSQAYHRRRRAPGDCLSIRLDARVQPFGGLIIKSFCFWSLIFAILARWILQI